MASGIELATAYLTLTVDGSGIGRGVRSELGNAESDSRRSGRRMGDNLATGVTGSMKGAVAGVGKMFAGLGAAMVVKDFLGGALDEARESQKVGALTASTIKATGGAAKITAAQVGDLAGALSTKTGIDDEVIQSGANMLLTFKNVRNEAGKGNDIFNQSTKVLTDMSSAMGTEPKQAAIQLGKALNDPIKGVTALSKVGVTFTDGQKAQIKTLVESGNVMGAQKIILGELNSEFGGAAEAQATAGDKAAVAWGNFKEAIGTALLPILDKLLTKLTDGLLWMTDSLGPGLKKVGEFFKPLGGIWDSISAQWGGKAESLLGQVGPMFEQLGTFLSTTVVPAVKEFAAEFGPVLLSALRQVGGFVTGTLVPSWQKLAGIFVETVLPILRQLVDHFRTSVLPVFRDVAEIILTRVVPAVRSFIDRFVQDALPAIQKVGGFIRDTLVPNVLSLARTIGENAVPIIRSLADNFTTHVMPALSQLWSVITTKVVPVIVKVGEAVIPVIRWVGELAAKILGTVVPVLLDFAGPVIGGVIKAVGWIVEKIAGFVGKLAGWGLDIWNFAQGMWSAITGAKDKIVGAWNSITNKFQTAKDWVVGAFSSAWASTKSKLTAPVDQARDGIVRAWNAITAKFTAAKDWVVTSFANAWALVKGKLTAPVDAARDGIRRAWDSITSKFTAAKNWTVGAFKNAWNGVKAVLVFPVEQARNSINWWWDQITSKFTAAKNWATGSFKRAWNGIKKVLTDPVDAAKTAITMLLGREGMEKVFSAAVSAVGRIWLGIKRLFWTPIDFVVNTILNRTFLGALRKIPGLGKIIPTVSIAAPQGLARGGILPGRSRYTDGDDQLVPMRRGEGVYVSEAMRDPVERARLFAVNKAAMQGKSLAPYQGFHSGGITGGLARGGVVGAAGGMSWPILWDYVRRLNTGVQMTSNYRSRRNSLAGVQSSHNLGTAIDIAGGPPGAVARVMQHMTRFGSVMRDLIYSPLWGGRMIDHGRWINAPKVLVDTHGDHGHIGLMPGRTLDGGTLAGLGNFTATASGGGFDLDPLAPIRNKVAGWFDGATKKIGGSWISRIPIEMGKKAASGLLEFAADKVTNLFGGGDSYTGKIVGGDSKIGGGVSQWEGVAKQAMSAAGLPAKFLPLLMSRMSVESGGNPRAINNWDSNAKRGTPSKGLMQTIDPTFNAYAGPYRSRGVYDPFANIYAAIKYSLARYGINGLARAWGGRQGYAHGGVVGEPPRFDNGGILAPGLNLVRNDLGKPEPLVRPEQVRDLAGGGDINIYGVPMDQTGAVADELLFALRRTGRGKYARTA